VVGEGATEKGASDGGNTPHATDETECQGTLLEGHYAGVSDDCLQDSGVVRRNLLIKERMTIEPEKRPAVPI
jgi:hypothetical protein